MIIDSIEIRVCENKQNEMPDLALGAADRSDFDFLVITLKTDSGVEGTSFGFAGQGASMAGKIAATSLKPFFLNKDPFAREKHWQEFRRYDRNWHLVPIYSYGPFDICMWDIASTCAEIPLYQYLGCFRDKVPVYASSLFLESPEAYAAEAIKAKNEGLHGYKLHPPGDYETDLNAYRACRQAVGPDFKLMADPVAAYTYNEALRMGRELEKLGFYWLEEPLFDSNLLGLKNLRNALDIPIVGTEVQQGSHYSTAQSIAAGSIDIVRTDVSWKGGITPVMKTAHLAESFGMNCELHTTIYHALEIVNLHCACAISNCEFLEVLYPMNIMDFGLKTPLSIDKKGYAHPPQSPGLGIEYDWDFIDNATIEIL